MSDKIVPRKERVNTLRGLLESAKDQFAIALPRHLSTDKLLRMSVTVLAKNEDLLKCTAESVVGAIMECAQLGLYPDNTVLGHAYLVPFNVKVKDNTGQTRWVKRCQLIPGYRGLLDLCRRSGATQWVDAFPVHDGDRFQYAYGSEPFIDHQPAAPEREDSFEDPQTGDEILGDWKAPVLTYVYAIGKLENGDVRFRVMPVRDIEAIRQRSRAKDKGPWVTDYEAMALKTVLRQWCKYIPMSPEITRAVALDELHEVGIDQRLADYAAPMIPKDFREENGFELPDGDAIDELADALEAARLAEGVDEQGDVIDVTPDADGGDEGSPAVESGSDVGAVDEEVDPVDLAYKVVSKAAFTVWGDDAHAKFEALRRSLKIPLDKEFIELSDAKKQKYLQALKTAIAYDD